MKKSHFNNNTLGSYMYFMHNFVIFSLECVKKVFGEKIFQENVSIIRRKCTQKCIDKSRAIKKE